MGDWLIIQCEKGEDPQLSKFIQANPLLDMTMRTILAKYLNLSNMSLEKWIEAYCNAKGECSQVQVKGDWSAKIDKMFFLLS